MYLEEIIETGIDLKRLVSNLDHVNSSDELVLQNAERHLAEFLFWMDQHKINVKYAKEGLKVSGKALGIDPPVKKTLGYSFDSEGREWMTSHGD